jgi:hypothetical protein
MSEIYVPSRPPLLVRQTARGDDLNWLWTYKRFNPYTLRVFFSENLPDNILTLRPDFLAQLRTLRKVLLKRLQRLRFKALQKVFSKVICDDAIFIINNS